MSLERSGCPLTVSLVLSVLSEDVGVSFSFESSTLYSKWNLSDERVRVNCKCGMRDFRSVSLTKGDYVSVNCGKI